HLRPTTTDPMTRTYRLSTGGDLPTLVCVNGIVPIAADVAYTRLATAFRPHRELHAVALPGYSTGEELPAGLDRLLESLASAVLRSTAGMPFAIVGFSSGGWAGHALTHFLETRDIHLDALVLIDTPPVGEAARHVLPGILQGILDTQEEFLDTGD